MACPRLVYYLISQQWYPEVCRTTGKSGKIISDVGILLVPKETGVLIKEQGRNLYHNSH